MPTALLDRPVPPAGPVPQEQITEAIWAAATTLIDWNISRNSGCSHLHCSDVPK